MNPAGEALAKRMSEAALQENVAAAARVMGWMAYHTYRSTRSEPGFPDWVFLKGNRMVVAELKSTTGKTTAAQEQWLAAFRLVPGCEAYVWRPWDWLSGDVMRVLTGRSAKD